MFGRKRAVYRVFSREVLTFSVIAYLVFLLFTGFCQATGASDGVRLPPEIEEIWDPNRYISIDEVRPGMKAYCLTVYEGTRIEAFELEVLSVVRNIRPGRDAILVQGIDERFIHTGPVAGCSGSPVYIDGRLAGALAFGWSFSKDPLYGVTPIAEMLRVGRHGGSVAKAAGVQQMGYYFDYSRPVDFDEVYRQVVETDFAPRSGLSIAEPLPCPLVAGGLPQEAIERLDGLFGPYGFMAVSGIGGGSAAAPAEKTELASGSSLGIPLVTGDITLDVIGTVTEVVGDKVYGFGHQFLGYGAVDFPMATAQVHTVVSNVMRSFKFATSLDIVGALSSDESTAIYGQIGREAQMFDFEISVDRYNDAQSRLYKCRASANRLLAPRLLYISLFAAAYMRGSLPPEHLIEYEMEIEAEGIEPIRFKNVSSGSGLNEMLSESIGPIAVLMNNPYKQVKIKSFDCRMRIMPRDLRSHIWSVDLSDSSVKAAEEITVTVVVESHLGIKKSYEYRLKVPEGTEAGTYELIVCGGYGYLKFLKAMVPYRFIPENLETLVDAMNDILRVERDKLYCILVLPSGGVTLERAELPDLPATKALVLQDAKRALRTQPYRHWLEQSRRIGNIVIDTKLTRLTVEQ